LSKDQIIERYAARSGCDVTAVRWYETFALFKIAVVIQQIFFRYKRGQTDDARFATFDERVTYLARQAETLATKSG
jgi:aminoglycoside phosphotransferase (APT) family kinase protein